MNLRKIHETLVYFGENLHERSGNVNLISLGGEGRFRKLSLFIRLKNVFLKKCSPVFDLG